MEESDIESQTAGEGAAAPVKGGSIFDGSANASWAANALRLTDEDFATAFRAAPDAVGISTLKEGRYVAVNEGFSHITGWSTAEAIGKTSLELGVWPDPAHRARFVDALRRDGEVLNMEVGLRRKSGESFTALVSAKELEVAGEPCILVTARDISARIRVEAAVRESETRHREAQRIAQLGHWDFDVATGRIRWSEETFRLFGVDPAQGEPDFDAYVASVHADDRERLLAIVRAALEEGLSYTVEHRIPLADGTQRYVEARGVAHRDSGGRVVHLSGTIVDVTDRKRAERALRASESELADAQRIAGLGRWEFVFESGLLIWSDSIYDLFEIDRAAFGASYEAFLEGVHPEDRALVDNAYRTSVENRTPYDIVHRLLMKDGRVKWVHEICRTDYDDAGKPTRSIGTVQDVTTLREAQETLRLSEERYRAIFDTAAVSMWEEDFAGVKEYVEALRASGVADLRAYLREHPEATYEAMARLRICDVNPAALRLHGAKSKEELLARLDRIAVPDTYAMFREELAAIFEGRTHFEAEVGTRTLAGESRQVLVSMNFPATDAQYHRVLVSVLDVTDRVLAQKALRIREAQLNAAIDSLPFRLLAVDRDGRFVLQNEAAKEAWGSVIGRPLDSIATDAFEQGHWRGLFDSALRGEPTRVELALASGKDTRHFDTIVAPIHEGESIWGAVGVLVDVTIRKRAEAALRESEQQLAEAQRVAGLGWWEHDFATGAVVWSDSVFDIVQADRDGFTGTMTDFAQSVHPDDREAVRRAYFESVAGRTDYNREHRIVTADGLTRWVHTIGRTEYDDRGKPIRSIGTVQDISGRKRAEEALRELNATLEARVQVELARNREKDHLLIQQSRLAAMGEMIGNIAHQWRQPINALGLLLSNLKDAHAHGELTADYVDGQVARASNLIQNMSTTIEDFRNFFKPNRAKQPFSLRKAVDDALSIVESAYAHHNIHISVAVNADATVLGFANEYTQVLLNLLSNAREAIEARGGAEGRVWIDIDRIDRCARVRVRDDGGGIPAEILPRVFDPYFTTRERGTGIGLYMSKMIIETNMDGRVEIRNLNGGTEVSILAPAVRQQAAAT